LWFGECGAAKPSSRSSYTTGTGPQPDNVAGVISKELVADSVAGSIVVD